MLDVTVSAPDLTDLFSGGGIPDTQAACSSGVGTGVRRSKKLAVRRESDGGAARLVARHGVKFAPCAYVPESYLLLTGPSAAREHATVGREGDGGYAA